jgi:HEPN domain-containing protein
MGSKSNHIEDVLLWVKKAEDDFISAEILIKGGGAPSVICFLCQQTVEKYVKALLVYMDIAVLYTHELDALADLLPEEMDFREKIGGFSELTYYAVDARYPGYGYDNGVVC